MYSQEDELFDKFSYVCEKCGYDRGILDHSQYSTVCPECKTSYTVTPVQTSNLKTQDLEGNTNRGIK